MDINRSTDAPYDVVIVGGRPAGASLACRLGARGLTVLVVDKAEFPSLPEVPSCPIMYASAMAVLDEIGFHEAAYRHAATRVHSGIVGFEGFFDARLRIPFAHGRDYLYGFDRRGFDTALWNHLGSFPTVTRRAGFPVTDVVRDGTGRVIGIEGKRGERVLARLAVIGADGRHSLVARRAQARVIEDQHTYTSTIHFAQWEGLAPATADGEPVLQIVSTGRGRNVLFFPSAEGRVNVATHARSDRVQTAGDAQSYYLQQLRSLATVRCRIAGARQVGPLLGVRRIANRYLEAGGPGWLLVGDALHHKDPVDGQGIYDALVEARHLAELLGEYAHERITWDGLVERHRQATLAETHRMFEATMERLKRDLYTDLSPLVIKTLARWSLQDPEYQRRFLLVLARAMPPEGWRTPAFMARVAARGLLRDLRALMPTTAKA